jgi:hypothetical protein
MVRPDARITPDYCSMIRQVLSPNLRLYSSMTIKTFRPCYHIVAPIDSLEGAYFITSGVRRVTNTQTFRLEMK